MTPLLLRRLSMIWLRTIITFHMVLNTGSIPVLLPVDKGIDVGKIDWTKLSSTDLNKYVSDTDALL